MRSDRACVAGRKSYSPAGFRCRPLRRLLRDWNRGYPNQHTRKLVTEVGQDNVVHAGSSRAEGGAVHSSIPNAPANRVPRRRPRLIVFPGFVIVIVQNSETDWMPTGQGDSNDLTAHELNQIAAFTVRRYVNLILDVPARMLFWWRDSQPDAWCSNEQVENGPQRI